MSTRISRSREFRSVPVEGEWLRISASITAEMPPICGRYDVIAQVRPSANNVLGMSSDPAPATFHIPTATLTVDGKYLKDIYGNDIPPEKVFPDKYTNRDLYPSLWGAVIHEGAHAAFTRWPMNLPDRLPKDIDSRWVDAAVLMEEPRVEYRQLRDRGGDRKWLRSCTKQIVMSEGGAPTDRGTLAKMFILIQGRVFAGVLDQDEANAIREMNVDEFGEDIVSEMESILREVFDIEDDDSAGMIDLGRRWVELLGEDDGTSGESKSIIIIFSSEGKSVIAISLDPDDEETESEKKEDPSESEDEGKESSNQDSKDSKESSNNTDDSNDPDESSGEGDSSEEESSEEGESSEGDNGNSDCEDPNDSDDSGESGESGESNNSGESESEASSSSGSESESESESGGSESGESNAETNTNSDTDADSDSKSDDDSESESESESGSKSSINNSNTESDGNNSDGNSSENTESNEGEEDKEESKSPIPENILEAIENIAAAISDTDDKKNKKDHNKEEERQKEAKAAAAAAEAAATVFKIFKSSSHGYGNAKGGTIIDYRPPTNEERGEAALLSRALRRAVIRERSATVSTSQRPPGRLRMRDGVSFKASVASGQVPVAEPFTRKIRKHNPSPPLRVGIAQDVSGSQSAFADPAAIAGWMVARAVSLIPDARSAMVTFGATVTPVSWPRQVPPGVPRLLAMDGYETPSTAIRALDGALNLTQPGFARLLFMVTDGEFVKAEQAELAVGDVKRLLDAECKVIWLQTGTGWSGGFSQRSLTQPRVICIDVSKFPANIGKIIADAVLSALKG